jgi:hypothetical protein
MNEVYAEHAYTVSRDSTYVHTYLGMYLNVDESPSNVARGEVQ